MPYWHQTTSTSVKLTTLKRHLYDFSENVYVYVHTVVFLNISVLLKVVGTSVIFLVLRFLIMPALILNLKQKKVFIMNSLKLNSTNKLSMLICHCISKFICCCLKGVLCFCFFLLVSLSKFYQQLMNIWIHKGSLYMSTKLYITDHFVNLF